MRPLMYFSLHFDLPLLLDALLYYNEQFIKIDDADLSLVI